jgi:hypothetical protein
VIEKAIRLDFDPQHFAFETGYAFRGLTISEAVTGFNVVLRAYAPDRTPVYAMTTAEHPGQGLERLATALSKRDGYELWRFDRFAHGSSKGGV